MNTIIFKQRFYTSSIVSVMSVFILFDKTSGEDDICENTLEESILWKISRKIKIR